MSEAAGTTTGSMEFEVDGDDVGAFFPVAVDFVSQKGLCGVEVRFGFGFVREGADAFWAGAVGD